MGKTEKAVSLIAKIADQGTTVQRLLRLMFRASLVAIMIRMAAKYAASALLGNSARLKA